MLSYNQGYGYTESGRILYAMRHDIWQKAHDATGATIPVEQRALKPIVYYVGEGTPARAAARGEAARGLVEPRVSRARSRCPAA